MHIFNIYPKITHDFIKPNLVVPKEFRYRTLIWLEPQLWKILCFHLHLVEKAKLLKCTIFILFLFKYGDRRENKTLFKI